MSFADVCQAEGACRSASILLDALISSLAGEESGKQPCLELCRKAGVYLDKQASVLFKKAGKGYLKLSWVKILHSSYRHVNYVDRGVMPHTVPLTFLSVPSCSWM